MDGIWVIVVFTILLLAALLKIQGKAIGMSD